MIFYKIRIKSNPEMFVKGTPYYQSHDKTGRIFQSLGKLRTFLTGVMNVDKKRNNSRIADWEIVELETIERGVKGVHEVITPEKLKQMLIQ